MAQKKELRAIHRGMVVNNTSEKREGKAWAAINQVIIEIGKEFGVKLDLDTRWYLKDIVNDLKVIYPEIDFHYYFESSHMRPDGGILHILDKNEKKYPILITEVKNQGTNDLRAKEGKKRQAKGNAIERLGKNVIGFRTALLTESIFPFICFGDGCDFASDSSILDRVVTISMFGELNKVRVHDEGSSKQFNRGSFFFREKLWTSKEMATIMLEIARSSVFYYFSKYRKENFI